MYDKKWQITINNFRISTHFKLNEFDCPCCHNVMIGVEIMGIMEMIREHYGKPIIITSGYRCKIQNVRVGGVWDSKHTYGEAEDIAPANKKDLEELIENCEKFEGRLDIIPNREKGYIHIELSKWS